MGDDIIKGQLEDINKKLDRMDKKLSFIVTYRLWRMCPKVDPEQLTMSSVLCKWSYDGVIWVKGN